MPQTSHNIMPPVECSSYHKLREWTVIMMGTCKCGILGSHSGDYEDHCFLGCSIVTLVYHCQHFVVANSSVTVTIYQINSIITLKIVIFIHVNNMDIKKQMNEQNEPNMGNFHSISRPLNTTTVNTLHDTWIWLEKNGHTRNGDNGQLAINMKPLKII
jgi:hypothetical protein